MYYTFVVKQLSTFELNFDLIRIHTFDHQQSVVTPIPSISRIGGCKIFFSINHLPPPVINDHFPDLHYAAVPVNKKHIIITVIVWRKSAGRINGTWPHGNRDFFCSFADLVQSNHLQV